MAKCLFLVNDKWVERLYPKFSEEEKQILENCTASNDEKRREVFRNFNERGSKMADAGDAAIAQEVYDKNKIMGSELIAVNIIIPSLHGSINCKVGQQYKVIRF